MTVELEAPPQPTAKSSPDSEGSRRTHPRIAAPPLVISSFNATVMNVSLGGACLMTNQPLEVGDEYELIATDGVFFYTVELKGRVVWAREGRIGLKWVDSTEQQVQWLSERFDAWRVILGKLNVV
jgi:hypothetical protein